MMSRPFDRTLRSLAREGSALSQIGVLTSVAALGVLTAWLATARVPLVVISATARVEVGRQGHPVVTSGEGRVAADLVHLGRRVKTGDVLLRLEARREGLRLGQERVRVAGLEAEVEALEGSRRAAAAAARQAVEGGRLGVEQAREQWNAASAEAAFAEREADRVRRLAAADLVAHERLETSLRQAARARAARAAARLHVQGTESEAARDRQDRDAGLRGLDRELAAARAELAAARQRAAELAQELDRREVTAPVSGSLVEWLEPTVGEVVTAGQRLGVILPAGRLRVVAGFRPGEALGRIRPGQPAEVRLDGFPWTELGTHHATVEKIAGEVRDRTVRVVLSIDPPRSTRLPLEHGLPGTVIVEVERLSPLRLLLRTLGAGEPGKAEGRPPSGEVS